MPLVPSDQQENAAVRPTRTQAVNGRDPGGDLSSQFARLIPTAVIAFVPSWIVLFTIVFLCEEYGMLFGDFSRDPLSVSRDAGDVKYYYGALSNLGIIIWSGSAFVSLFTSVVLRVKGQFSLSTLLAIAGVLTLMLLFDDLFLLHERVLPEVFQISEDTVFSAYLALVVIYLAVCLRTILKTDYLLLGLALLLFLGSMLQDRFLTISPMYLFQGQPHILEDGSKFLGIVAWGAYLVHTACYALIRTVEPVVHVPARVVHQVR